LWLIQDHKIRQLCWFGYNRITIIRNRVYLVSARILRPKKNWIKGEEKAKKGMATPKDRGDLDETLKFKGAIWL
jgi:hypothetical protein